MSETRDVILAIDVGDARLAAGLMTMKGELLDRDDVDIDFGLNAEALFASLNIIVQAQLERARTHHNARPAAVGVGCVGPVRPDVVAVSPTNIHAWRSFPLRSKLASATTLNVYGDLGAKALALAEGWLGAAQGRQSFLAMVVASTVEGGIVLNGQLLDGATGNAGHVGHIVVEPNGRRCLCGSRGCLDAEASGPSIEAITGRSPREPTYEIMQRTGRLVGRAVATTCNLLDIDLAVVGGAVADGFGATFFNSAQETLDEHAQLSFSRSARVIPARLGGRGPLLGAGAIGLRGLHRASRHRE
ncbi:MAG: ROK family protein [Ilumatobacteraceae bacterium]